MPTADQHTHVHAWALAGQVERHLVRAEASVGLSVRFAARPLTPTERKAKTRFGDLDSIVEVNTAGGFDLITGLYGAALGAVLAEVFDDGEEQEGEEDDVVEMAVLTGTLAYLLSYRPPTYTRRAARDQEDLASLITRSYDGGVATVLAEARRQGVDTGDWDPPTMPGTIGALAGPITDHPFLRIVERAIQEYTRPNRQLGGPITRRALRDFLEDTSQAGTQDLFRQSGHAALNAGRNDMAEEAPPTPATIVASEVLDQNTCGPCASIDGTTFDSLDEARAAYPAGYVNCQGGSRCRGVLVFLWEADDDDG